MRNEERIDTDERIDRDERTDLDGHLTDDRVHDDRVTDNRVTDTTDGAIQPGFEQSNDADFERRSDAGFEQSNDAGFEQSSGTGFERRDDAGLERSDAGVEQAGGEFRPPADDGDGAPTVELFATEDVTAFRASWDKVQTRFVDDPQAAVQDADNLVADVMQSLQTTFADRKQEWAGEGPETENLRQALRRYRSFLDRLLNA